MALVSMERYRVVVYTPDLSSVTFVAKMQKAKTRKNKDYFVLRTTVPKDIAEKIDAKAGDYIFFRAKKAQWYHMLDWKSMENTWKMLPDEIRNRVVVDGLYGQGTPNQSLPSLGAVRALESLSAPTQQVVEIERTQNGDLCGSRI